MGKTYILSQTSWWLLIKVCFMCGQEEDRSPLLRTMPNTNCVVVGCSSSTYQLKKWKETHCDIHGTLHGKGTCICPPPFRLFCFPRAVDVRKKWTHLVNRSEKKNGRWTNWTPREHSRVCSKHFLDKEPTQENPLPTLHLGHRKSESGPKRKKLERLPPQTTDQHKDSVEEIHESLDICEDIDAQLDSEIPSHHVKSLPACPIHTKHDHKYDFSCTCSPMCICIGCKQKEYLIRELQDKIEKLESEVIELKKKKRKKESVTQNLLRSDSKVTFYTGLPNLETFYALFHHLEPKASKLKYWRGAKTTKPTIRKYKVSPRKQGPPRKTLLEDEFLLTLMKLRLDIFMEDLADRFSIGQASTSNIFNTWIRFLSQELSPLVFFPDRDVVHSTMLQAFREQGSTARIIIHYTEVKIESPRDLRAQALTWSDYKNHNTIKFLVGVTLQGHVAFISKAWGGRTSDKHIVQHSGFLNHLDPVDESWQIGGFPFKKISFCVELS